MYVALTNYGLRYAAERLKEENNRSAENDLLLDLYTGILAPYQDDPLIRRLLREKLIDRVPDTVSKDAVALRYQRNPLEHVTRIVFEYTTHCNLACQHCYNAGVERATEQDINILKAAADVLLRIGIDRFDLIGGEVSRYGDGWLDLVRHIRDQGGRMVTLYTNGWWLEQHDLLAAGRHYADEAAYLDDLRKSGLTHVVFSLDGPEEEHDRSRGQPGLYRRVLAGIDRVRAAGLEPRVSLLIRDTLDKTVLTAFLHRLAGRIYSFPPGTPVMEQVARLVNDPTNTLISFIDIGRGAQFQEDRFKLSMPPDTPLYCKAFFRPAPFLTIKANGELATCRIANAGEGYGNLHRQDLVEILNRMQEQFIFRLHAERRLGDYLRFVDPEVFGDAFAHLCTLRAILTLIAQRMEEASIDPEDRQAIRRINLQVARYTGHRGAALDASPARGDAIG